MNKKTAIALAAANAAFGGLLALGFAAAPQTPATVYAQPLPYCQTEDGSDVDGQCIWIDPDTGDAYINPTPAEVGA